MRENYHKVLDPVPDGNPAPIVNPNDDYWCCPNCERTQARAGYDTVECTGCGSKYTSTCKNKDHQP